MSAEHSPEHQNGPIRDEGMTFLNPDSFIETHEETQTVDAPTEDQSVEEGQFEDIEQKAVEPPRINQKVHKPIEVLNTNHQLTILTPNGEEINVSTEDFIRDVIQNYDEERSGFDESFTSAAAELQKQMARADYTQLVGGIASDVSIRRVLASRFPGFSKRTMEEQDAMVLQSATHLGNLQTLYQSKMAEVAAINADEAMYNTMAEMFSGGYLSRLKGWLTVDDHVREQLYQKVGNTMDLLLAAKFGKLKYNEVKAGIDLSKELQLAKAEMDEAGPRAKVETLKIKEDYKFEKATHAMQLRTAYYEAMSNTTTDALDKVVVTLTHRPVEAGLFLYDGLLRATRENFGDLIDKAGSQIGRGINYLFNDEDGLIFVKIPGSLGSGLSNLVKRVATPQVAGFVKWGGFAGGGAFLFGITAIELIGQMGYYDLIASYATAIPLGFGGWAGLAAGLYGAKNAVSKSEGAPRPSRQRGGGMNEMLSSMLPGRQSQNENSLDDWGQ